MHAVDMSRAARAGVFSKTLDVLPSRVSPLRHYSVQYGCSSGLVAEV